MLVGLSSAGGSARGGWERFEAFERGSERWCPIGRCWIVQHGPAGVTADPSGLVGQPVAQPVELPAACLVFEAKLLGEGDQVPGEHHEPQPHLVVGELAEREVTQPAVLGLADAILNPGVATMVRSSPRMSLPAWSVINTARR
jgi:hypothetical protein